MKKTLGKLILKLLGWTMDYDIPKVKKYVLVVAPHTSAWDMIIGKLYNWALEFNSSIIVKKEFFYFPVGIILRKWGAVGIDRQNPKNIVQQIVDEFGRRKEMILTITPEGTRRANPNWKTGFYRIATTAKVPIYLIYGDFKRKHVGWLGEFIPTGDMDKDIEAIKQKYKNITAYRPEWFAI
ncbi:MAG: 1-acyl-sn-glycerol-3-phosphate acyltransferase [Bacteroidota bacterium]|nr:1-acyl-sn-glycerol-3-phosphate acyltransferase [Bacteroidota bacterium]